MSDQALAEKIAGEMRETLNTDGFVAMLHKGGDYVDTHIDNAHEPPNEVDAVMTKAEIHALYDAASGAYDKLFPEGFEVDGEVTVDGNVISTDLTMRAKLADGTPMWLHQIADWSVENGHVVSCLTRTQDLDESSFRDVQRAVAEAGIEHPTR